MTDSLSERLEKAKNELIEYLYVVSDDRDSVEMTADSIVEIFTPILRDEIAAVRERTLEELISECHRYPVMCMVEGWLISKRALKTPPPEMSK